MAGIGDGDNGEVLALGLEPVQESDTLVDRDLPERYDLKLWIGSGDVSAAYLPG